MTAAARARVRLVTLDRTVPDARTSLADARTALCLARGVPLSDIDPATGHDLTRRAYRVAVREWRQVLADGPLSDYMRHGYQQARAYWAARRPEYLADGDWPDAA